jgi:NAD(P)-dependent dehydrogenase (short-subunit alcohol dehydrogenase family)
MTIAITGASSGIGRALAVDLAARGARLALAARRVEALEELNGELGGGHLVVGCDVADPAQCAAFVQTAHRHFGRLDTLVCNAGIGLFRRVADTTTAEWEHIWRVNVLGTTACLEAVVPLMRAQSERDGWRGQIMVTSSVLALRGVPDYGAYCATKAAQLMLAQAARVELAGDRIAVTSVHPASTQTDFNATAEVISGRRKLAPSVWERQQAAATVAAAMRAAIIRPRAEVWPKSGSRMLFHLLARWTGVSDAILGRHRRVE